MSQITGFIGGGNMASALIGGLLQSGVAPENIYVADPDEAKCNALQQKYGIHTSTDNQHVATQSDVILLAVKPQQLHQVIDEIVAGIKQRQPLLISIAAGIRSSAIIDWLGADTAVIRCMPNTPALIQQGITGLYATPSVSAEQKSIAEKILQAVGEVVWIDDETQMDTVTALSGSGPAYFFLFIESLIESATALGLTKEQATRLAIQTGIGACQLAAKSKQDVQTLRKQVTSPGGTTEQGILALEKADFRKIVHQCLSAARARGETLSKELE